MLTIKDNRLTRFVNKSGYMVVFFQDRINKIMLGSVQNSISKPRYSEGKLRELI